MKIVSCTFDRHASQILDLFNDSVLNSTAIFDYQPFSLESMADWFQTKRTGNFPVIGLEDEDGQLLGFASYGVFRNRPAYKYSVEHSVYVHKSQQGRGIGRKLMHELVQAAQDQGYHILVGVIEASNKSSIALHESLGFTHSGTVRQAGFKFNRWLDIAFYQLILPTPENPADG